MSERRSKALIQISFEEMGSVAQYLPERALPLTRAVNAPTLQLNSRT